MPVLRVLKDSASLAGHNLNFVEGNSLHCSYLYLYPRDEPIFCGPLSCPTGVNENPDCTGPLASGWVLQKVMDIHHVVGLSCEGFEGKFMALLTACYVPRVIRIRL
jgi:hypothetical protein